jgi:hypothetical protein
MEDPIINIKQAIRQLAECGVNTSELMSATLKAADMFREIKDSDGEWTRREIVDVVENFVASEDRRNRMFAWLEDHKAPEGSDKQVSVKLSESGDKEARKQLSEFLFEVMVHGKNANFDRFGKADCAKWIDLVNHGHKSAWKPTDGQLNTLRLFVLNQPVGLKELRVLESLYDELKKL